MRSLWSCKWHNVLQQTVGVLPVFPGTSFIHLRLYLLGTLPALGPHSSSRNTTGSFTKVNWKSTKVIPSKATLKWNISEACATHFPEFSGRTELQSPMELDCLLVPPSSSWTIPYTPTGFPGTSFQTNYLHSSPCLRVYFWQNSRYVRSTSYRVWHMINDNSY